MTDTDPDTRSAPSSRSAPAGEGQPLPSFSEQLADQLGGIRGILESGVPVAVFVIVNIVWTLRPALAVAVGSAVLIGIWRLARRQPVRHAVNGVVGIAIGAVIAWKTGSAKDFYLPGILLSLVYGVAMLASVALRRPVVGWVWSLVADRGRTRWRANPRLMRTFSWLTVVWALTYLAKTLIQAIIFRHTSADDPGTALGIARLALGYPPYLLLLALTAWAARRATAANPPAPTAP